MSLLTFTHSTPLFAERLFLLGSCGTCESGADKASCLKGMLTGSSLAGEPKRLDHYFCDLTLCHTPCILQVLTKLWRLCCMPMGCQCFCTAWHANLVSLLRLSSYGHTWCLAVVRQSPGLCFKCMAPYGVWLYVPATEVCCCICLFLYSCSLYIHDMPHCTHKSLIASMLSTHILVGHSVGEGWPVDEKWALHPVAGPAQKAQCAMSILLHYSPTEVCNLRKCSVASMFLPVFCVGCGNLFMLSCWCGVVRVSGF